MEKKYQILQLSHEAADDENICFCNLSFLHRKGFKVVRANYRQVYEGVTELGLDGLYQKFNIDRPADFFGHSMSVSDIVILDGTAYYVDDFGFAELPGSFLERGEFDAYMH